MASRELKDLHGDLQFVAEEFVRIVKKEYGHLGIALLITCTWRSGEDQEALYAQGRTKPGRIVTWARAGKSKHNVVDEDGHPAARAFDVVPLRYGKPIWGTDGDGIDDDPSDDQKDDLETWQRIAAVGESLGLEWAGRWPKGKREFPHFQASEG